MNQFKIGDMVVLKSGGPKMMIERLPGYYAGQDDTYSVIWYDEVNQKIETCFFHPNLINLVND